MIPGTTLEMEGVQAEADLFRLCTDLKLRNVDTVVRSCDVYMTFSVGVGFTEKDYLRTEFPATTSRFMASPKRM
jgi:hypothetical protein